MQSTLTAKGQTTVPKELRDLWKLSPGAKVKWFIHPDGSAVIRPIHSVSALKGILKYDGPPVKIEDMDPSRHWGRDNGKRLNLK